MKPAEIFYMDLVDRGLLVVGKDGSVLNTATKRYIGTWTRTKAKCVGMKEGKKLWNIQVHRLMWIKFNGPIPPRMYVMPIDGDYGNLDLENFKLSATHSASIANLRKAWAKNGLSRVNAKLTMEQVVVARKNYRTGTTSVRKLAAIYNVSSPAMLFALTGKTWKDCPEPPVKQSDMPPKIKALKKRYPAKKKYCATGKTGPVGKNGIPIYISPPAPIIDLSKYPKTVETIKRLVNADTPTDRIVTILQKAGAVIPKAHMMVAIHSARTNLDKLLASC